MTFISTVPRSEIPAKPNCGAQVQGLLFGRLQLEEPTKFYTVAPCRVVDTRNANGPFGGPALSGGTERTFQTAGQCALSPTAKGVALNATVTGSTQAGALRIFPAGIGTPLASIVNYSAGQTRANNGVVGLGASGALTVRVDQVGGSVHLIIDVVGYFE